ncbi:hypothetical protein, partial [Ethanoligenens sp.]|uniref:DUF7336 domain-containing protein n=1 Tax=Ethanoligenens sp. TaxID=2099655 RepID=UPI0039EAEC78
AINKELIFMDYVYMLKHSRVVEESLGNNEKVHDTKLLGFFSTKEKAKAAICFYLEQPGFKDYPDDFVIQQLEADVDDYHDTPGELGLSVFYLSHE